MASCKHIIKTLSLHYHYCQMVPRVRTATAERQSPHRTRLCSEKQEGWDSTRRRGRTRLCLEKQEGDATQEKREMLASDRQQLTPLEGGELQGLVPLNSNLLQGNMGQTMSRQERGIFELTQKLLQHGKPLPSNHLKILLKWSSHKLPEVSQSTIFTTNL